MRRPSKPCAALISVNYGSEYEACELAVRMLLCPELLGNRVCVLDIWSKSNYQVFQKVTDHATTALLHYQLPQMPDVVVRSFMTWLRSYIKLFQTPCQRCGKYLQDGLPPTWRDFRTLEAFHDTCRQ
ncbi:mediator of RNA polymerase II transcription subunit 27 isoform X2 [Tachysurus ichikawai]